MDQIYVNFLITFSVAGIGCWVMHKAHIARCAKADRLYQLTLDAIDAREKRRKENEKSK